MATPVEHIVRLEELSLNAWPAPRRLVVDGWILQFSDGFTGRANSVHPVCAGTTDVGERIHLCEVRYAEAGLPPMFKMTPASLPSGLDEALIGAGYRVMPGAFVQTASLNGLSRLAREPDRAWDRASDAWVTAYGSFRDLPDRHYTTLRSILAAIALPTHFVATHDDAGEIAAVGLAVHEGEWVGLFDIIVRPDLRGRGHGRRIVESLLAWSAGAGARRAYLQVAEDNVAAISLYTSLGFAEAYTYRYYRQNG